MANPISFASILPKGYPKHLYAILAILPSILFFLVIGVWAERKLAGFIQDRYGPMEVGYKGILQSVADGLKLLQKEDIVPKAAEKHVFLAAPVVIFASVFAGFAVLPMAPGWTFAGLEVGLFYLLGIISLDAIGFILAGWSSNNKFTIYGAMRAVSQIISYEVPLSLAILAVVMTCQSLNLQEIVAQQGLAEGQFFLGVTSWDVSDVGGLLTWNIFRSPILILGLVVFFIASLAEANRAPFDIPEAESEIIAGFYTEYSGFRMSIVMLTEYMMMWLVTLLGITLFLGGWQTPLPNIGSVRLAEWTSGTPGELSAVLWGLVWLFAKAFVWVFFQFMARWTYPRLRVDQLMYLCWKVLTPAALLIVLVAGVWRLWMN